MICLSSGANLRPKPKSHAGGNQGRANADQETERASAFHPRAAEGNRRSALLRRDEGRARSALQIGHPSADHGARGARLHPPAAQPRPGARSASSCPNPRRRSARAAATFSPSVIEGNLGRVRPMPAGSDDADGRRSSSRSWAASPPARRSRPSRTAATPSSMPPEFLGSGEHFALEVRGDSMIEAGIFEGDTVVIRKQDTRRYRRHRRRAGRRGGSDPQAPAQQGRLDRARGRQPGYETRIFGPDRVRIQGKLVSLIRRY